MRLIVSSDVLLPNSVPCNHGLLRECRASIARSRNLKQRDTRQDGEFQTHFYVSFCVDGLVHCHQDIEGSQSQSKPGSQTTTYKINLFMERWTRREPLRAD